MRWGRAMGKRSRSVPAIPDDERDGPTVDPGVFTERFDVGPTARNPFGPIGDKEAVTRYALVYGSDNIWDTSLMIAMKPVALRLAIGNPAFKEWASSPDKLVIQPSQIVFDPTETCSHDCINLFTGLPTKPIKGDCADLMALLLHLVSEAADTDQGVAVVLNFVLDWLAYPLQHPGAKMATALVFHGPQGTGKNLFFEAYARIFGEYAAVIGQAQLESRYNDWASRKLFLIGDEIVASNELTHHKNALKSYVTAETVQVETKFQPVRTEKNHANFVFLSNDNRPLALERDDRRHLVVYCPPKRGDDLYTRVRDSLDAGAVEALFAFLLARDLSDFHAHTLPPMTKAKAALVELGLRPAERFAREWLGGELDLPMWPCSTGQLYKAFGRWCRVNGDRLPPNQANFSAAVTRFSHGRLTIKVTSPSPSELGSPIKLWLPAGLGPLNGVRWIDYARDCVAAFDAPLSRFHSQHTDPSQ
jgi:putative DNA primase/helicase